VKEHQKKNLTWSAFLTGAMVVLCFAGCAQSHSTRYDAYAPRAARSASASTYNESADGLIRLGKTQPTEASLGGEFLTELTLTAQDCAANVVLRDIVPTGASYARSEPAATVEGRELIWKLGELDAGQVVKTKVWFKAEQEGPLTNCATVSADPRVCGVTLVGKPGLSLETSGPETAVLGKEVTYKIVVKSTGNVVAHGVVVSNSVPPGLSHSSGRSELSFDLGDLAPGQSKSVSVTFKANQRGKVCNVATAHGSNAGLVQAEACTVVLVPGLKVEKSGTKEQILGRNADYEITVANSGDTILRNVVITDNVAAETSIVAAPGATFTSTKATWTVPELKPGAKVNQAIKLTSKVTGTHCGEVTASADGLSESAKTCTLWKGIPAVLLEVVDEPDPIQVGESTTYTIKITNQGFADLHNLKVMATFDDLVVPVSTAEGVISGRAANFPPLALLGAKQVMTYRITVKGVQTGDSRNQIVLTGDELKTPVEKSESTTVY